MAKRELLATLRDRYRCSSKKDKSRILDEFIGNSSELRGSEQLTAGSDGVESLCSPGAED